MRSCGYSLLWDYKLALPANPVAGAHDSFWPLSSIGTGIGDRAWPDPPEAIKAGIVAMVKAAQP
jgi:hypothetical protein